MVVPELAKAISRCILMIVLWLYMIFDDLVEAIKPIKQQQVSTKK